MLRDCRRTGEGQERSSTMSVTPWNIVLREMESCSGSVVKTSERCGQHNPYLLWWGRFGMGVSRPPRAAPPTYEAHRPRASHSTRPLPLANLVTAVAFASRKEKGWVVIVVVVWEGENGE